MALFCYVAVRLHHMTLNNPWSRTVADLGRAVQSKTIVSRAHYSAFCHAYLFDALRGLTFGQAFCKKFSIHDNLLIHTLRDEHSAQQYIKQCGYVR